MSLRPHLAVQSQSQATDLCHWFNSAAGSALNEALPLRGKPIGLIHKESRYNDPAKVSPATYLPSSLCYIRNVHARGLTMTEIDTLL